MSTTATGTTEPMVKVFIMRKYGVDEAEAQAMLDGLKHDGRYSDIERTITAAGAAGQALAAMPEDIRPFVGPIMQGAISPGMGYGGGGGGMNDDREWMANMMREMKRMDMMAKMMGISNDNKPHEDPAIQKLVEKLDVLADEKAKKETEQYFKAMKDDMMVTLQSVLPSPQGAQAGAGGPDANRRPLNDVGLPMSDDEYAIWQEERTLNLVNRRRALAGKPPLKSLYEEPEGPEDLEHMEKRLIAAGKRVMGPPTIDEVRAEMEKQVKEAEKRAKEQAKKEAKNEEMVGTLITEGLGVLGDYVQSRGNKGGEGVKKLGDAIRKARDQSETTAATQEGGESGDNEERRIIHVNSGSSQGQTEGPPEGTAPPPSDEEGMV